MKSNNLTLGDILNSHAEPVRHTRSSRDTIAGTSQEWEKLWDNLAELQRFEKTGRHFLGFLVLVPESPSPGKLTTIPPNRRAAKAHSHSLSLLLCAVRDTAKVASGLSELAHEVEQTCLVHPFKKGVDRFRLYPKQRDQDQFVAAIQGHAPVPMVDPDRIGRAVLRRAAFHDP